MAIPLHCGFGLKPGLQRFSSPEITAKQELLHHLQKKTPAE
jgi:hypothetical protein